MFSFPEGLTEPEGVLMCPGVFPDDGGLVADPPSERGPHARSNHDDKHDAADEPPTFSFALAGFFDERLSILAACRRIQSRSPVAVDERHLYGFRSLTK